MEAETRKVMARLNPHFRRFKDPVEALSGGQRQSVAVARAIYFNAASSWRQIELWLTPEGEADLLQRQCLKRRLVPQDVANMALFLASDDSTAITAQSYLVDGGWV